MVFALRKTYQKKVLSVRSGGSKCNFTLDHYVQKKNQKKGSK